MKKFFVKVLAFSIGLLFVFEVVLRANHMTIDIPQREITSDGIQRYIPNQDGWWIGGTHKWHINEMGWPGPMPESFDSLILIIGDSHIENFMNSDDCHQCTLLKKELPQYNFLEAARSGVSFIEAMHIAYILDTLNPKLTLFYVKDSDFLESISQLGRKTDLTQINLDNEELLYGEMRSPLLKKILYNVKSVYYVYNKLLSNISNNIKENEHKPLTVNEKQRSLLDNEVELIEHLLQYSYETYASNKQILLFHPGSDERIVSLANQCGYNTIVFPKAYEKSWGISESDVSHWTCEGHKAAAEIVAREILNLQMNSSHSSPSNSTYNF